MNIRYNWINWRNVFLDDRDLSQQVKGVGLYLSNCLDLVNYFELPPLKTICEELNIKTEKTADKYIKQLENENWITGKDGYYKLAVPQRAFTPSTQRTKPKTVPGQLPAGDVRLTANVRKELHTRLKLKSAQERTSIGEIVEQLLEKYLDKI